MRVLSWNLYHYNKKLPQAVKAIKRLKPDVVCLQEVHPDAFPMLEALKGYTLFKARDFHVDDNGEVTEQSWLVILSRLPVAGHTLINHGEMPSDSIVGWWTRWVESVESQSVTVTFNGKAIKVVNCHLSCAVSQAHRRTEMAEVMAGHVTDGEAVILCGDFNTMGRPLSNIIAGWLFGIKLSEMFTDEQKTFDAFCAKHGFTQLFQAVLTHPLTFGNLDHILVTQKHFKCTDRRLGRRRYGSDHRMLIAEIHPK